LALSQHTQPVRGPVPGKTARTLAQMAVHKQEVRSSSGGRTRVVHERTRPPPKAAERRPRSAKSENTGRIRTVTPRAWSGRTSPAVVPQFAGEQEGEVLPSGHFAHRGVPGEQAGAGLPAENRLVTADPQPRPHPNAQHGDVVLLEEFRNPLVAGLPHVRAAR